MQADLKHRPESPTLPPERAFGQRNEVREQFLDPLEPLADPVVIGGRAMRIARMWVPRNWGFEAAPWLSWLASALLRESSLR